MTVLAGYTRCPKCKAPLPAYGNNTRASLIAGGTAVDDPGKLPILPLVLVGLAIAGGITYFALRKSADKKAAPPPIAAAVAGPATAVPEVPSSPTTPNTTAPNPGAGRNAERGRTRAAANAVGLFEASLNKQHLWSTVKSLGTRVDVRSATCEDPQMAPTFDAAAETLRRRIDRSALPGE